VRSRLRAIRGNEAGTTLIEISMTMLLLGVVMTMFLAFVSSIQNATGRQEARVERNDEVRLALAQLDREIRSGNVLYDPSSETNVSGDVVPGMSLRIYTQADAPNRNPGNQCSQWRITNGVIQTRRWATADPSGSVTPWWTVAHNIVNRTVSPQVPAFALDTSSTSYGSRLMKIRLVVDRPDDSAGTQEVDLSLTGRNTQYKYPLDICSVVPGY
jgi:type II secretory pathway component PulJ